MNRRGFLNILGKTILATSIALKIPDILLPKIEEVDYKGNVLTYSMLENAYNKAIQVSYESNLIIMNKTAYNFVRKEFDKYENILEEDYIGFKITEYEGIKREDFPTWNSGNV